MFLGFYRLKYFNCGLLGLHVCFCVMSGSRNLIVVLGMALDFYFYPFWLADLGSSLSLASMSSELCQAQESESLSWAYMWASLLHVGSWASIAMLGLHL